MNDKRLLLALFLVLILLPKTVLAEYWGSKKSDKFHYPSCKWAQKIKPGNRIVFKTKEDAIKVGYIPCKVCRPFPTPPEPPEYKADPSQVPTKPKPPKHVENLPLPNKEIPTCVLSTQDIASMYWNAVVSIVTYDSHLQNVGQGSGFVVNPSGVIVTNSHVINSGTTYLVIFPNKTSYYARILKEDKTNDIATLRINADNLPVIPLGKTEKVSVGDKIVVIGSPLGLPNTVTEGIVSAIRVSDDEKRESLQISAPVSPGSSGSAVINVSGQCIGIATMVVEKGQNINFAVPIEYVISLLGVHELP